MFIINKKRFNVLKKFINELKTETKLQLNPFKTNDIYNDRS